MSQLSVGILGIGHIGAVHLQAAEAMDGVSVLAAADEEASKRELATRLGVPAVYSSCKELLEREPVDVAVVALPPFLHEEAIRRSIEAGAHVFVEKPFASSTEEGRRLIEAAAAADVSIGVDHTLRYQSEMQAVKAAYDSGTAGSVPMAHVSRINSGPFEPPPASEPVPDWPLDPDAVGGGAVMDLGVHLFDLLEWLFGEMEVCHAELGRQLGLDYEDTAAIVLRSGETGTIATVHCGYYQWEEPPDVNMRVRLDGVAKTIESADYVPNFFLHAGKSALENLGKRLVGEDPSYFEPTYYYRAHFETLEAFVDAVHEGREPPASGFDGLRAIELVEETYRVAAESDTGSERSGADRWSDRWEADVEVPNRE